MQTIESVYFIGAGGIGMSALERYFLSQSLFVGGYDRTETPLTKELIREGADIHYTDDVDAIPQACRDPQTTLVVYTPAVPKDHHELTWFRQAGFEVKKRAEVLGYLTRQMKGLCVAGTHGKTTTTAMAAHLLHESHVGCNAFLGGIAKNYATNYLLDNNSDFVVIEADEFDRSFHHLQPYASVITATDPDHLDIYGTEAAYLESFTHYTSLIRPDGALIVHKDLKFKEALPADTRRFDYSRDAGDFHAENIRIGGGRVCFDLISPLGNISEIELGVPVSINVENGIAAIALAQIAGATPDEIREGMRTFQGVDRRFDFKIKSDKVVLLSDYAHHPAEVRQSILSVREVFDGRRITGIFQPHLYTRTRDFYREFAESLSLLDEVILLDIYPARELPIEGVSSKLIYDHLQADMKKHLCDKSALLPLLRQEETDVVMVLGAGDVDAMVPQIAQMLKEKYNII
jgi:UDP-N-acetylmuramate--L-alanine ligase